MEKRHYPVVLVTRNYDTGKTTFSQEHFRPQTLEKEIDDDKWWIPLTYTTQTSCDFSNTVPINWLRPQDHNITISGIDPNDWILVNLQQMGEYWSINTSIQIYFIFLKNFYFLFIKIKENNVTLL